LQAWSPRIKSEEHKAVEIRVSELRKRNGGVLVGAHSNQAVEERWITFS
jgi:hypothetical protein